MPGERRQPLLTSSPTLSVNFKAMQGEGVGEHWPEPQRSGATPTSLSSALTSPLRQRGGQGRLEEYVQGAGGVLGTKLSECGPRCSQEIPPQDKSTASDAVFVSSLDFPAAAWDPSSIRLFVVATGKHPQTPKPCLYGKG